MDIVQQAAQVAQEASTSVIVWPHESDRRIRRAQTLPFSRSDLGGWAAVVRGLDARYGLDRVFLNKVYPIAYQKRPSLAFDCSELQSGQILQMHGFLSRNTQEDRFYRVVANTDQALTLEPLTVEEVIALYRS